MRRSRSALLIAGLAAGALAAAGAGQRAAADPMPMSAGESPAPSASSAVALRREELSIDVGRTRVEVTAVLHLENLGPPTTMTAGFPCDSGADPGLAGLDCKTRIAVKLNGRRVPARKAPGHWVWPMRLEQGQTATLEVKYETRLRNDRYDDPLLGLGTLYYRLTTGARWAGPIGALEIQVNLPTDAIVHVAPAGHTREHGLVRWSLADVEPDRDLAILFEPRLLARSLRAVPAASGADLRQRIERGRVDAKALRAAAAELAKDVDHVVELAAQYHEVARKRLGLPAPAEAEVRAEVARTVELLQEAAAARKRPRRR